MRTLSVLIRAAAAIAGFILVLWILLDLAHANTGTPVVHWFQQAADWLSGWARGIFSTGERSAQILLDYGLPAVLYLAIGYAVGRRSWE
ncbi:hypothetical protein OG455_37200 [Kitasatospora sp. NBC_01287]|uniref:hypothetical protein n=1 Tax=Kitasatospora sp. NBC_01287 TaxID=2903573 RepID=UPI0022530916|nr:hypothetical protein [Kitasatospora sp. NBC_01287]MCX4751078.1 hypothetical protein [Kitasatospora sp. NBC_01287]